MTATPQTGPESPVDETIGLNVHSLLYRQKTRHKELALVLGITPSVLSKKLRGDSAWSARQVSETAYFLGVEPGRLYQPTVPRVRPELRSIPGGGRTSVPRSPLLQPV